MIEVVIAMLVLALGSMGILNVVDASTRNNYRIEQSQVVVNVLEGELERIKQLPYEEVALTSLPAHATDQNNPSYRVSSGQFAMAANGTELRPLVVNGTALAGGGTVTGGKLSASPKPFHTGDISGSIQTYVVWVNDASCPEVVCPGAQDLKRVIVAATLDNSVATGQRAYQELHADLVDPDVTPVVDRLPGGSGEEGSFATFWLTDTPCNQSERQPLTGDHVTHNTMGTCSAGVKSANTPGAPDLMFTEQPKLEPSLPADQQPLYDYSTDVEPSVGATLDRGLQIRNSTLPGCIFSPSIVDGTPGQKVHRWLSPPMPNDFQLLLDGKATLSIWTRTLNGAQHPGRICVFLFARKLNALGIPVDVPMVNKEITNATWFPHEETTWPRENWTEVSVDMDFLYAAGALLPGERLGLAISVEKGGTNPGDGLEFMYDHPSFDSRLQIETSSVLPDFG
jgi:Tfp pilus assembly protein PilV